MEQIEIKSLSLAQLKNIVTEMGEKLSCKADL